MMLYFLLFGKGIELYACYVYNLSGGNNAAVGTRFNDIDPTIMEKTMDELLTELAELTPVMPFGAFVMTPSPATEMGYDPRHSGRSHWTTNEDNAG